MIRITQFIFITIMLIWITGCKEITTTTTIHPDGSCDRIVEVEGDSSDVVDYSYFPVPKGDSWTVTQKRDLESDSDYKYKET